MRAVVPILWKAADMSGCSHWDVWSWWLYGHI